MNKKMATMMRLIVNLGLVVCLLGLMVTPALAAPVAQSGDDGGGGDGSDIVAAIQNLGVTAIDICIGIAFTLLAVGIATGFVGGQLQVTLGQPYGLSSAWMRVIGVVMCGVGAILSVLIANTVVNALRDLKPATDIPTISYLLLYLRA